jgi:hypothetical protein
MSVECSECEMDARAGHLESCSRFDKLTDIESRWIDADRSPRLTADDVDWLIANVKRLSELVAEVKSCGHDANCPAGVNDKYRCRCYYSIILESEQRTAQSDTHARPDEASDSVP